MHVNFILINGKQRECRESHCIAYRQENSHYTLGLFTKTFLSVKSSTNKRSSRMLCPKYITKKTYFPEILHYKLSD